MFYLWQLIAIILLLSWGHTATLEERILQEREARLKALEDAKDGRGIPESSLSNVADIDERNLQLRDPADERQSFTLKDAIESSLSNNPKIQAHQARLESRQIQARSAGELHRPIVDFKTGWNNADTAGTDNRTSNTRRFFDVTRLENSFHAGLEFTMPIYDSGKSSAKRRIKRLQAEIEELEFQRHQQDIIMQTSQNFIQQMVLTEKANALNYRRKAEEEKLSILERENRDPSYPDKILEQKLKLHEILIEEQSLRDRIEDLKVHFRQICGLEAKEDFVLQKRAKTRVITETREGIDALAESFSLQLKQLQHQLSAAREEGYVISSHKQPNVDLMGQTTYARTNDRFKTDEVRWMLGFEMDLNLLDAGRTRTKQEVNHKERQELRALLKQARHTLNRKLDDAFFRMESSRRHMEDSMRRLELARGLLFEAEARFERGQISLISILRIREKHKLAVHSYYSLLGNMIIAKLELFALMGKLGPDVFG